MTSQPITATTVPPIVPYPTQPARVDDWDPRVVEVHHRLAVLINERRPDLVVDHIGSSAVPGLPGKNVVDLGIEADPGDVPAVAALLEALGFQRTVGIRAFPPTRPLLHGGIEHDGEVFRVHAHVHPRGHRLWGVEHARDLAFRDALRADPALREEYAARKRAIVEGGTVDAYRYTMAKTEWIRGALERIGVADPPILPPATIGVLGGGQLGRMLGFAARSLGYRLVVLDPDPDCPAAAVADQVVNGRYDDVDAGLAMAETADLVTLELEHVGINLVSRLDWEWPVRPGMFTVATTQDRIEERRFLEGEGAAVAEWREVGTTEELQDAATELGLPLRLKARTGGYDGRSQVRLDSPEDLDGAFGRLGRPDGASVLAERELVFAAELSVICARTVDGRSLAFPVARNRHDDGILVESVAPAPIPDGVAAEAQALVRQLAEGLDLVGTLTAELFLMPDGGLVVNELAPRVHNTGHWTAEACRTSQFEQHIRAICGLPLGSPELTTPVALVNILGEGPDRPARVSGVDRALRDPAVSLHLYDKMRVFERRKMGHVVATGRDVDDALDRARAAVAHLNWDD